MILYPTETLYALGVNALDEAAQQALFDLKGRDAGKPSSWLVRDVNDIAHYGVLTAAAAKIAKRFLPGSLTLVLAAQERTPAFACAADRTIGFRMSPDPVAQKLIEAHMAEYAAPLTCTSANVSGSPVLQTPSEILQQFGPKAAMIKEIHDDGPRKCLASTVVRVVGEEVTVLREGEISERAIMEILGRT